MLGLMIGAMQAAIKCLVEVSEQEKQDWSGVKVTMKEMGLSWGREVGSTPSASAPAPIIKSYVPSVHGDHVFEEGQGVGAVLLGREGVEGGDSSRSS